MIQGKFNFAQLTEFLQCRVLDRIVQKHNWNKYVRTFTYWNHMLCMVSYKLTAIDSMRHDVELGSSPVKILPSWFWSNRITS